jgi:3-oxoacyl-[acyl-carrier-protein] synthase-1
MHPNPYGRIPSEGAAAVVLTSGVPDSAWCVIRGAGGADEDVLYSDEGVCLGKGLIRAAQKAVSVAGNPLLESIISDVNGEPYRADELGFTLLKLSNYFTEDYTRETPTLASGDLGCSGLLTHLALVAWQMRSSVRTGNVMVLSSSDDKRRGAVVLSAVQEDSLVIMININWLTKCHKGSDGVSHNTPPDVCKTPCEAFW